MHVKWLSNLWQRRPRLVAGYTTSRIRELERQLAYAIGQWNRWRGVAERQSALLVAAKETVSDQREAERAAWEPHHVSTLRKGGVL